MLALRAIISSISAVCVIAAAWMLIATAGATAASVGFIAVLAAALLVFA